MLQKQFTKRLVEVSVVDTEKLLHKTQWWCGSSISEILGSKELLKVAVLRGGHVLYEHGLQICVWGIC